MPLDRNVALGVIGQLILGLDKAYTGFAEVVDACVEGAANARNQLRDFSHFDFNPKFRTRVINVPRGIEGMQDLWSDIKDALTTKISEIVEDSEAIVDALKHLPPRLPGEPLLQRSALILNEIHAFNTRLSELIRKILDFTQTIDDIKHRIETLDDLFLPNTSTKKTIDAHYRKRNVA